MTGLSVNLNKIALLRNARGDGHPDLATFALRALELNVLGVTVHPRADERHATISDLHALAELQPIASGAREFNIEGDLRSDLVAVVDRIEPTQFTVVPVEPGEVTSSRGWRADDDHDALRQICRAYKGRIRVAVFCDPNPGSCRLALNAGAEAVELFTGPYAVADPKEAEHELSLLVDCVTMLREAGVRVNGGHNLSLDNMPMLLQSVDFDEFSIGHHLTCDALNFGWEGAIERYLQVISASTGSGVSQCN